MAPHTKEFREKLTPLEGALYDERLYQAQYPDAAHPGCCAELYLDLRG